MDSNSLLILFVICSSADALTKTWSRTSGDTVCNYTLTYDVVRKFEVDEVVGEAFICASTETCVKTMTYEKTFIDPNQNVAAIDDRIFRKVEKIKDNSIFIQNIRHVSGSISCIINPGYKGQITMRTKFQRIVGNREQRCLTQCEDCVENVYTVPFDTEEPINDETDQFAVGEIRCTIDPAANFGEMKQLCNTGDKAKEGSMLQAINEVVQKAVIKTPLMGSRTIEKVNVDGVDAWALAICWNGLEQTTCQACLSFLANQIVEKCSKSIGAQLYVKDCGLRYEIREIIPFNYEDSFPR